jgi:hypothetical protein
MRKSLSQHFDVVVVIWVLALICSFSVVSLSRTRVAADHWSAPQNGPAWIVPTPDPAQQAQVQQAQ